MEDTNLICSRLKDENEGLKRAVALNQPLLKKLNEAIARINKGEYVAEEEFFRTSVC